MIEQKYKNPAAQMLAHTRWSKATDEQKSAQAAKMVAGRKKARKSAAKKKVLTRG